MHDVTGFCVKAAATIRAENTLRKCLAFGFGGLLYLYVFLIGTLSTVNAQITSTAAGSTVAAANLVPGPYIGIGAGLSQLDPEIGADDNLRVTENNDSSVQFVLGADVANWISLELHGADLGSAAISDGSSIDYREFGLSALIYAGGARDRFNRRGWTVFGRTGIAYRDISVSDNENLDKGDGPHWILGAGAEHALANGIGLRAEGIAFDNDVSLLQIGLIYRLGKIIAPSSNSGISALDAQSDADGDGVVLADDNCPDTPTNIAVGGDGCAIFNGVVDGVAFQPGSARLTPGARTVLDGVAESLLQLPNARARVASHTDNVGEASVNMQLSQWRAFEVARYLVDRGVHASRLEARAFGETRPIDVNSTSEGRRNNRRVEITLIAE